MMSHREASRAWGVSRATIQRAIKAGKLSLSAEKTIDKAEMVRVFGEPSDRLVSRPAIPDEAGGEPGLWHPIHARIVALEAENSSLKVELAGTREALAAKDENLADLRAEVLRLAHERPARRRWWPWGK